MWEGLKETGAKKPHQQLPEEYSVLAACVSEPNPQSHPQRHPDKRQGLQWLEERGRNQGKAQTEALTWIPSKPCEVGQKQKHSTHLGDGTVATTPKTIGHWWYQQWSQ